MSYPDIHAETLREYAKILWTAIDALGLEGQEHGPIYRVMDEAADEIDRLCDALKWCSKQSAGDEGAIPAYVTEILGDGAIPLRRNAKKHAKR